MANIAARKNRHTAEKMPSRQSTPVRLLPFIAVRSRRRSQGLGLSRGPAAVEAQAARTAPRREAASTDRVAVNSTARRAATPEKAECRPVRTTERRRAVPPEKQVRERERARRGSGYSAVAALRG